LFVVLEHFIGFDDVLKDEFDNLLLKTWRDILYEQRELLLVLLTLLRVLQETDNTRLQVHRQPDILHRGIDLIQLFLEGI